jgi:integrase/recombinase XerD
MDELLKDYIEYCHLRKAKGTVYRIQTTLNCFSKYLHSFCLTSLSDLDKVVFFNWLKVLEAQKIKPITLQGYLFAIRGFCRWLYNEGHLLVNPFPDELIHKRIVSLPRAVPSIKNAAKFLAQIKSKECNPLRDLAILELCYGSGLRKAEVQRLNVSDIKGDTLRVLGKGNKERMVPLGMVALKAIGQYLSTERSRIIIHKRKENEALFLTESCNRMSLGAFNYIMKMNRPKGSKITLHSFRHACATHMLKNGANVRVIQKLLGHSKISSTQIYTRLDTTDLKEMLEKFHPRK